MKDLFVPHDIALSLREKGFNEPCFGWWNTPEEILLFNAYGEFSNLEKVSLNSNQPKPTAPLYWQVRAWLYKKGFDLHDYYIAISNKFGCDVYDLNCNLLEQNSNEVRNSREESYNIAIKQVLERL